MTLVVVGLRRPRLHTQRAKVHQAGESEDPIVHGVNDVATIELKEPPSLDTWETEFDIELTKRPSASQLFKRNIALGTILIALGKIKVWYPSGPGPSPPEDPRLSM